MFSVTWCCVCVAKPLTPRVCCLRCGVSMWCARVCCARVWCARVWCAALSAQRDRIVKESRDQRKGGGAGWRPSRRPSRRRGWVHGSTAHAAGDSPPVHHAKRCNSTLRTVFPRHPAALHCMNDQGEPQERLLASAIEFLQNPAVELHPIHSYWTQTELGDKLNRETTI